MDNLDDSENTAKVSDSAYSNSCSNSQSRRSHSSKSTHSGSNSSGSSGYGGKQSISGGSTTFNQLLEKRAKDKERKKKKQQQVQGEPAVQNQAVVEFRLPEPAPVAEAKEKPRNASPPSSTIVQSQNGGPRSMEMATENIVEETVRCSTPQPPLLVVACKPSCSEGFSCVISMHDGVVLYMSSSLTATLGFPKDMWIGRSFIDLVHPLDHNTFSSHITNGLAVPKKVHGMQDAGNSISTMFCRIRKFRGLETGFNVKDRSVSFMPFTLRMSFKNVCDEKGLIIYLIIQATPLFSAFKIPNETVESATPFVMRQLANGKLDYIDHEAVTYVGYLPQDIIGLDVLKLYHPEDLAYVRHVFETIIKQEKVTRSKPYRFLAQNGHYIKIETEWSSFINPWSRKLEFVIGKHHVVEGPASPNVFEVSIKANTPEADGDVYELRESILRILKEVPTRPAEFAKQLMTKRCQNLASFMESLIEEQPKLEEELRLEIQENDNSYYERDSVMLGGISPHHDYNDSKSSSGTPMSYNQLNFNINLKRYFDCHEEFVDEEMIKNIDRDVVQIKGQYDFNWHCVSPMSQEWVEVTSLESPSPMYSEEGPSQPFEYQPMRLTESLLNKHNSDMEKIVMKKHRETRPSKEDREKISSESKQKKIDHLVRCNASFVPTVINSAATENQPHGLKRASKQAEATTSAHKQRCTSPHQTRRRQLPSAPEQPSVTVATVSTSASFWPSNVMNGMTPVMTQQMSMVSPITAVPGFVPMYYVPAPGPSVPCTSEMSVANSSRVTAQPLQAPAVPYMMYSQPVFGSPFMVSPFPVQQNVSQSQYTNVQNNLRLTTRNYEEACKPGLSLKPPTKSQRAAWREEKRAAAATTAAAPNSKVEQSSSASGSICSATNALNRSTETVPDSSVSRDSNMKIEETVDRTDGESSYSSFYSSFFKTESGSAEDSSDAKKKQTTTENSAAALTVNKDPHNKNVQRRKVEPPWMEQVCVTSELVYKYQVLTKTLEEVLISDKNKLNKVEQPSLVNEQLGQLYMDLQLEGVAARLTLEEGVTSSSSSSDENNKKLSMGIACKGGKRRRNYGKLVMIYEEDAPIPPPDEDLELEPSTSKA